jgi:hypothetical protein
MELHCKHDCFLRTRYGTSDVEQDARIQRYMLCVFPHRTQKSIAVLTEAFQFSTIPGQINSDYTPKSTHLGVVLSTGLFPSGIQCTSSLLIARQLNIRSLVLFIILTVKLFEKSGCMSVRFEVFTAMTMKNAVCWDVTPYGSDENRRFGEMKRRYLKSHTASYPITRHSSGCK